MLSGVLHSDLAIQVHIKIMLILDYLKSFEQIQKEEEAFKSRKMIGFQP